MTIKEIPNSEKLSMTLKSFLKVVGPFWLIEFSLTSLLHILGYEVITLLGIASTIISIMVLPFLVGVRILLNGGGKIFAVFGGISISIATLASIFISYAITSTEFLVYMGAFISVIMFTAIQAIFAISGFMYAKKLESQNLKLLK